MLLILKMLVCFVPARGNETGLMLKRIRFYKLTGLAPSCDNNRDDYGNPYIGIHIFMCEFSHC